MIKTKPKKLVSNKPVLMSFFLSLIIGCNEPGVKINNDVFSFSNYVGTITEKKTSDFSGYYTLNGDTMFYSIGLRIYNLSEELPTIVYIPDKGNFNFDYNIDTSNTVFSEREDFDKDKFRRQNIYFERFNNQVWKYSFPIDTVSGGLIGVYVDSIDNGSSGVLQFNAFISNPSSGNYNNLKKIISSIQLEKPKSYEFYLKSKYVF